MLSGVMLISEMDGMLDMLLLFLHELKAASKARNRKVQRFILPKLTKVGQIKEPINSNLLHNINAAGFDNIALDLFRYQYHNNELYRAFTDALHVVPDTVDSIENIPFLPISFFKTHRVASGQWQDAALIFESSGTTGTDTSKHYVHDAALYREALLQGFRKFYGEPQQYVVLALLPSYLERGNSSLVHMASVLMQESGQPESGFYLNEQDKLSDMLQELEYKGQAVLLLGVTFALLDFAEKYPQRLQHTIVMETGGMKGRREELTCAEVHERLKKGLGLVNIHSEYGMTELLSQAYARKNGLFEPIDTMKVLIRDINDPLDVNTYGSGGINIIDLANVHSCAFIATEDLGNIADNGKFEVLGRMDRAMLRGCSLMII